MRITDLFEEDTLSLPNINVGDSIKVGKFKNRKAIVKGFTTDDHNQPVLKTTKGDQKLFKPRISKLEEGLIAVPQKMEQKICRILVKEILWWARDRFKGKTTTLSEQYKAFKALVKEYDVVIPKQSYYKDKIIGFYIPVNFEGMPEKYLKNSLKDENIRFAIVWDSKSTIGGTGMLAGWMKNKKILAIKPMSVPYLQYYPSQGNHPDDLKIALVMMFEAIQHELRHVVQTMLLSDHPEQSKTKDASTGQKGYYILDGLSQQKYRIGYA